MDFGYSFIKPKCKKKMKICYMIWNNNLLQGELKQEQSRQIERWTRFVTLFKGGQCNGV